MHYLFKFLSWVTFIAWTVLTALAVGALAETANQSGRTYGASTGLMAAMLTTGWVYTLPLLPMAALFHIAGEITDIKIALTTRDPAAPRRPLPNSGS